MLPFSSNCIEFAYFSSSPMAHMRTVCPTSELLLLTHRHTERLTAEFDAGKTEEIRTFDDYMQLEDRLFAELKEKVYAHTGTGPEYALVRYSAGSAADPLVRQPNWNRSFEIPNDNPVGGALLLHGMSDSPYTYRALGKALSENG